MKYLLDPQQKEKMLQAMEPYMSLDQYGRTTIRNLYFDTDTRNLYFDTDTYRLVRHSIEKPAYKEKLRIRSYSQAMPYSTVFVELKKKYKKIVYKRRIALPEKEAMEWVSGERHCSQESQISEEIDYFFQYYQDLHPAVFLSYEREAYYSEDHSDFRVTFDEKILCRQEDLSLESEVYGTPILPKERALMEIKCSGGIPLCLAMALLLGLVMAFAYMYRTRYTKSFVVTLALLPAVVCVVIMMVNGNVGTGVAVAGAFSLVRFRSVPGTAREICTLFLAMGAGLITGMGYLGFAVLFTLVLSLIFMLYNRLDFGAKKNGAVYKTFAITISEDLDYTEIFDDIFQEYALSHELIGVKTTNMGSLFRLTYHITLRDAAKEKEMIDKIRCRNGNLEIAVSRQETTITEL